MNKTEIFSIRQLVELTGLSEFTIRGWENRYKAFKPHRSDTGRREYSKADVQRALLLRELLKRGHKISKIAKLNSQKLQDVFESTEHDHLGLEVDKNKSKAVSEVLELMALQKWSELSESINKVPSRNINELVQNFTLPLISGLSTQVETGLVSVAQEHILSSMLKEKIQKTISDLDNKKKRTKPQQKIRFVLAAPEGDHHDIGLLLAHLIIRSNDFTSLYLGPHTPAQDLAETALRFEASHLLIVSNTSKSDGAQQDILNFASDVYKKVGSAAQILIAGRQSAFFCNDSASAYLSFSSFNKFENYLRSMIGKS